MSEFAIHQAGYGDYMAGRSVSPGSCFCVPNDGVGSFNPTIFKMTVKPREDTVPMVTNCSGRFFYRFQATAISPTIPAVQRLFGIGD